MTAREVVVIIPARLGSTRFPGKVLADRTGKPIIQHVFEAAQRSNLASRIVIATDADRVLQAARSFGAQCVLTRPEHPNGTSRLDEAAGLLRLSENAVVVNVQGDEPELEPEAIDAAVDALLAGERADARVRIATIAVPFGANENPSDPNCVKVVRDRAGCALYFSRSLIPCDRDRKGLTGDAAPLRHVGLYVYRRTTLVQYAAMQPTPLEQAEQLEQLRALEHGWKIAVALRPSALPGIDTPEQYEAFVQRYHARTK